jgi:hypothetical protein
VSHFISSLFSPLLPAAEDFYHHHRLVKLNYFQPNFRVGGEAKEAACVNMTNGFIFGLA